MIGFNGRTALLCVVCIGAPGVLAVPPGYTVTDLGTLPGATRTEAYGVNNTGQVVGQSGSGAFLWENGSIQDLGLLPGATLSFARAVNDNSVVVGESGTFTWGRFAFLWEQGTMTSLITGVATDVNNRRQVVGGTSGANPRGFLWEDGVLTYLPTLGGAWGSPAGINEAGVIAGYALTADGQEQACRWVGGEPQSLGSPVPANIGWEAYAKDINDAGQILGFEYRSGYVYPHPFIWEAGVFTHLPYLPGSDMNFPKRMNNAAQAVGSSYRNYHEEHKWAVLWESNRVYDLNTYIPSDSGWVLQSAEDINDLGLIVGWGEFAGQRRAFLLTPIPEPATLMLVALCGQAAIRRRRR